MALSDLEIPRRKKIKRDNFPLCVFEFLMFKLIGEKPSGRIVVIPKRRERVIKKKKKKQNHELNNCLLN